MVDPYLKENSIYPDDKDASRPRKNGRPPMNLDPMVQLAVRVEIGTASRLREVARVRGIGLSEYVRSVIGAELARML